MAYNYEQMKWTGKINDEQKLNFQNTRLGFGCFVLYLSQLRNDLLYYLHMMKISN